MARHLHSAVIGGHLDVAKLLMVYGADLNAINDIGQLPIDCAHREEIKQAIRDEPRRRMDDAPGKRATDQDRHPNPATSSASVQQEEEVIDEDEEPNSKKPRLVDTKEDKVAEEDEDSEPSDEEDD